MQLFFLNEATPYVQIYSNLRDMLKGKKAKHREVYIIIYHLSKQEEKEIITSM